MNDMNSPGSEGAALQKNDAHGAVGKLLANAFKPRRKPGPKKKETPRSEKVSCRLTKDERAAGLKYCKAHGLIEANLLRASYLAAVAQTPDSRITGAADAIARLPDKSNTHIRAILKKSGMIFLFILLCSAAMPTVAKYFLHVYQAGQSIIYRPNDTCVYHPGEIGCEMVPR